MSAPVQEGEVIRQKYRVDRVLGEGGMGVVVAAWHLRLEQRVAIKFLRPAMLAHPDIVERFLREARAASKIEGDHVARVLDVDTLDDGAPFMVMEYLEGSDLSRVRREGAPLLVDEAVRYVLEACEAIAEAHGAGIVHRDLKPANIFLAKRRDGRTRVKVLDFGISKLQTAPGTTDLGMTRDTAVMGSVEYMSPEQMLSSRNVDARTDIWALGIVLYELCTARVPFPGTSLTEVCALVMSKEPPAPRTYRPDLPEALEAVILRCLVKDREKRLATVGELVEALRPFATAGRTSLLEVVPSVPTALLDVAPVPGRSGSSTTAVTSDPVPATPVRPLWPVAIGGVVLLGVVAVVTLVMIGHGGEATKSATPMETAAAHPAAAPSAAPAETAPVVSVAPGEPAPLASASSSANTVAKKPVGASPAKVAPSAAPSSKPTATAKPGSGKPQID